MRSAGELFWIQDGYLDVTVCGRMCMIPLDEGVLMQVMACYMCLSSVWSKDYVTMEVGLRVLCSGISVRTSWPVHLCYG